jgi:hypothetical protein
VCITKQTSRTATCEKHFVVDVDDAPLMGGRMVSVQGSLTGLRQRNSKVTNQMASKVASTNVASKKVASKTVASKTVASENKPRRDE